MIREFVTLAHTNAVGLRIGANEVEDRNLGLLAAIFRIGGDEERFAMGVDRGAIPLVEPLRSNACFAVSGLTAFQTPLKHLHAVGKFLLLNLVHGRAITRAPKMGQASAGN